DKDFEDSINNDIEGANNDPYFEELDEEFLQISVEEVNMEVNDENELAINNFFNINSFEQNQIEISEENLAAYSQRSINTGDIKSEDNDNSYRMPFQIWLNLIGLLLRDL
ncbi:14778_t:CDS:2, partial [Dentiscutata heterogama]